MVFELKSSGAPPSKRQGFSLSKSAVKLEHLHFFPKPLKWFGCRALLAARQEHVLKDRGAERTDFARPSCRTHRFSRLRRPRTCCSFVCIESRLRPEGPHLEEAKDRKESLLHQRTGQRRGGNDTHYPAALVSASAPGKGNHSLCGSTDTWLKKRRIKPGFHSNQKGGKRRDPEVERTPNLGGAQGAGLGGTCGGRRVRSLSTRTHLMRVDLRVISFSFPFSSNPGNSTHRE